MIPDRRLFGLSRFDIQNEQTPRAGDCQSGAIGRPSELASPDYS